MSLHVHHPGGHTDRWQAIHDERDWFDFTHQVAEDELVVFQHTFRRVRERVDRTHDALLWKHHTTKVARRYPPGTWSRVSAVSAEPPPTTIERAPRVPRAPRERRRR